MGRSDACCGDTWWLSSAKNGAAAPIVRLLFRTHACLCFMSAHGFATYSSGMGTVSSDRQYEYAVRLRVKSSQLVLIRGAGYHRTQALQYQRLFLIRFTIATGIIIDKIHNVNGCFLLFTDVWSFMPCGVSIFSKCSTKLKQCSTCTSSASSTSEPTGCSMSIARNSVTGFEDIVLHPPPSQGHSSSTVDAREYVCADIFTDTSGYMMCKILDLSRHQVGEKMPQ